MINFFFVRSKEKKSSDKNEILFDTSVFIYLISHTSHTKYIHFSLFTNNNNHYNHLNNVTFYFASPKYNNIDAWINEFAGATEMEGVEGAKIVRKNFPRTGMKS